MEKQNPTSPDSMMRQLMTIEPRPTDPSSMVMKNKGGYTKATSAKRINFRIRRNNS
jgi:hypothetical protein